MAADEHQKGALLKGTYRLIRQLGEGGAGTVFEARHQTLGHHVAIKILFRQLARIAEIRDRFVEEAQIQAQLRHPNLVAVVDILDDESGLVASVMEFVKGRSLGRFIKEQRPVDQDHALAIATGLLRGLEFAHERGIVHRDVKPDNILLDESGDEPVPRLTDFGIAKLLASVDKRTRTGTKLGTVFYMAPEQVVDSSEVDARADIYAAGITLYELFTGEVPFSSENIFALMDMHRDKAPPAPSSRRADLLPGLERIILKALEKRPDDRFQSSTEMLEALEAIEVGGGASGAFALHGAAKFSDTAPQEAVLAEADSLELDLPAPPPTPGPMESAHPTPRRPSAAYRPPPRPAAEVRRGTDDPPRHSLPPPLGASGPGWTRAVWRWSWVAVIGLAIYQVVPFGHCVWEVGSVYRAVRSNDADFNASTLTWLDGPSVDVIGNADGFGSALSDGAGICLDEAGFGAGHPFWINGLLVLGLLALVGVKLIERLARQEARARHQASSPQRVVSGPIGNAGGRPTGRRRPVRLTPEPITVVSHEGSAPKRALLRLEGNHALARGGDAYLAVTLQHLPRDELQSVGVQARVAASGHGTVDLWGEARPLTALSTGLPDTSGIATVPFVVSWEDVDAALRRSGIDPERVEAVVVRVSYKGRGVTYRCDVD